MSCSKKLPPQPAVLCYWATAAVELCPVLAAMAGVLQQVSGAPEVEVGSDGFEPRGTEGKRGRAHPQEWPFHNERQELSCVALLNDVLLLIDKLEQVGGELCVKILRLIAGVRDCIEVAGQPGC